MVRTVWVEIIVSGNCMGENCSTGNFPDISCPGRSLRVTTNFIRWNVFDGLTLNNKLTLIIYIYFFNTIHLSRSIKITDNLIPFFCCFFITFLCFLLTFFTLSVDYFTLYVLYFSVFVAYFSRFCEAAKKQVNTLKVKTIFKVRD